MSKLAGVVALVLLVSLFPHAAFAGGITASAQSASTGKSPGIGYAPVQKTKPSQTQLGATQYMLQEAYSSVGCAKTFDGAYTVHTCASNSTFNVTGEISNASILIVGGGGAGRGSIAYDSGSGGHAGKLVYNSSVSITGINAVVVGGGGAGMASANGGAGMPSSFLSTIAAGGEGGSIHSGASCAAIYGGNGTGEPGSAGSGAYAGAGGIGLNYSISGSSVYYGGGGGGACSNGASGGLGGGGAGDSYNLNNGAAGVNGLGAGGGGASAAGAKAGWAGGSGIVIIRYLTYVAPALGNLSVNSAIGGIAAGNASNFQVPAIRNISAIASYGYAFSNWSVTSGVCTIANATSSTTTVSISASTNCVILASFVQIPTASLVVGAGPGGSVTGSAANLYVPVNISISATASTGYSFSGWSVASGSCTVSNPGSSATSVAVYGNCSVLASFAQLPNFTVTVISSLPGCGLAYGTSGGIFYGSSHAISAAPLSGCSFLSWNVASGNCTIASPGSQYTNIMVYSNCYLVAQFALPTYPLWIAVAQNENENKGSVQGAADNIEAGSTMPISATPAPGYAFSYWDLGTISVGNTTQLSDCTVSDSASASTSVLVNGYCSLFAYFVSTAPPQYPIHMNVYPLEAGTAFGPQGSIAQGSAAAISVTPSPGYSFSHWFTPESCSIANASSASTEITINDECYVFAMFTLDSPYHLWMASAPNESVGVALGAEDWLAPGSIRPISAILVSPGYVFSYWDVGSSEGVSDCIIANSTSAATSVLVNSDCTLFAVFSPVQSAPQEYAVHGNVFPDNAGSVSGIYGPVPAGTQLGISAAPYPGYAFSNWILNGNCAAADALSASTTVAVNGACNAFAIFTANPTYNLLAAPAPAGTGTVQGEAYGLAPGSVMPISATPAPGYSFSYWAVGTSGNMSLPDCIIANSASASTTVTVNEDCGVFANFISG